MKKLLITGLLLSIISLSCSFAKESSQETDLPKVLIIGDSISIGYTPHVKKILKGKAVVIHHKGNAQHTSTGLKKLDSWLGDTEWDVIHFNWGLWDLCYRNPTSKAQGNRDKANGKVTSTLELYNKNLEQLVTRLKKTNAKLIWAHTTIVPDKEAGRIVGDDKKYNDLATKIMKKHGVTINDLHSLTKDFSPDLFAGAGDVHYKQDGYKKIGQQVAGSIQKAINGEQ